jgi:hypothetical protein
MASASLLAYLIVSKFADGLPLYRMAGRLRLSRVNQGGKRDNQDGKFFEGAISEAFSSDLTALEAI